MIYPYYNVLIFSLLSNQKQGCNQSQSTLIRYFQEYFENHLSSKGFTIRVLGQKQTKFTMQAINMIENIFGELGALKVNNSFTRSQQIWSMKEGLQQIKISEALISKRPATLDRLEKLKQYFDKFKTESEMKEFLKTLLIEEISYEKKTIKYRKKKQIQAIISVMLNNIQGEIKIVSDPSSYSSDLKGDEFFLMEREKNKSLETVVSKLKAKGIINENISPRITQQLTLLILREEAQTKLRFLYWRSWEKSNILNQQIKMLRWSITHSSFLKVILRQGFRLVKEEEEIKQAFLQYVKQMKQKYTDALFNYFKGFKASINYTCAKTKHLKKQVSLKVLQAYLMTFSASFNYNRKIRKWQQEKCSIIQKRIKAFLLIKQKQKERYQHFLFMKENVKLMMKEYYSKLLNYYNRNEIEKLKNQNKFKYGFSCCTHMIQLTNHNNFQLFDPHNLLSLFEKIKKSQQLVTKIACNRFSITFSNIEGKTFTVGQNFDEIERFTSSSHFSSKENDYKLSNNTAYNSRASLEQSKLSYQKTEKNEQLFKGSRISSNCKSSSLILKNKQQLIKTQSGDSQFMIDQQGRLFGRGNNSHGQLGLGQQAEVCNFTLILKQEKVKSLSSTNKHTVVVTTLNKIFYFGAEKGLLPSNNFPFQLELNIGVIKQVVCSIENTYFLTDTNKVYSFNEKTFLRIPKQISLGFDHFGLIRTGTYNAEIVYFIGFWCNTLDKTQKSQISRYLTRPQLKQELTSIQSILVDNFDCDSNRQSKKLCLNELSDILEQNDV